MKVVNPSDTRWLAHEQCVRAVKANYTALVVTFDRMIHCGTHDGYDIPPAVPMFSTTQPKRPRRESLADTIAEGVTALSKALGSNTAQSLCWL